MPPVAQQRMESPPLVSLVVSEQRGEGGGVRPEEEEEVSVVALRTTRLLNFLFLGDGRYLD